MATEAMQHGSPSRVAKALLYVATFIAIVGAVNWGLIGLFNWNLVDAILGGGSAETTSTASRIVYGLVGVAGLVTLVMLPARHRLLGSGHRAHPLR